MDIDDNDEGVAVTQQQLLAARLLARNVIAFGEDVTGDRQTLVTNYNYKHMEREYTASLLTNVMARDGIINIGTDEWEVSMWLKPSMRISRRIVDIHGNIQQDFIQVEHLPMFDGVDEMFRVLRNSLLEATEIVFAFWLLTYGVPYRLKSKPTRFFGDQTVFERDMLALKMDDAIPVFIGGL